MATRTDAREEVRVARALPVPVSLRAVERSLHTSRFEPADSQEVLLHIEDTVGIRYVTPVAHSYRHTRLTASRSRIAGTRISARSCAVATAD